MSREDNWNKMGVSRPLLFFFFFDKKRECKYISIEKKSTNEGREFLSMLCKLKRRITNRYPI